MSDSSYTEEGGSQPFDATPLEGEEEQDLLDAPEDLSIISVETEESLMSVLKRLEDPLQGELPILIIFPKQWNQKVTARSRIEFFTELAPYGKRVTIAGHDRVLLVSSSERGLSTIETRDQMRRFLRGHPDQKKALRHYSSEKWQEWLSFGVSRLKILSVHRVSVTLLCIASGLLFLTVLFVALPSARIRIWPRLSLVSHTANVMLVSSGAVLELKPKNELPLIAIQSDIHRALTFNEISKKFMGENAEVEMTIINEADEPYSFRAKTRLANQAGMVFRTLESVTIPAATLIEPGVVRVQARAMSHDLYDQIVGERGNVPAGLKWEILGIPLEERILVYARNTEAAVGGKTAYGTELRERDLELAKKQLEQELLREAKVRTEERVEELQEETGEHHVVLQYDVLTAQAFSGFVLPTDLIGESPSSIPVEGAFSYRVLSYSKDALLQILLPGLLQHVEDGQELIETSVMMEGISVHVIEYDDDLAWVKITAELTGKQRAILSVVSATGRAFGERVRDAIRGKSVQEAERIIQNFPEVDRVEVKVWPPWRRGLPSLVSNIVLLPQE
jgi:hypothetical protein